ncbi:MAG: S-layer homology domain-containing protein, partial [Oscillospiraceae bacterium]
MRIARRMIAAVLMVLLLVSFCVPVSYAAGLDNFADVNAYEDGRFTDVSSDAWYTANVAKAYNVGLMMGDTETTFNPTGNLTRAEAATIAARMHSIYHTGTQDFSQYQTNSAKWYTQYVRYLEANAVFTWPSDTNFAAATTREEFAGLLANTLPATELQEINTVENKAIPDLYDSPYYDEVYLLYRAGVLAGNKSGKFMPEKNLSRAESAAIVSRMIDSSLRQRFTLRTNWVTMYAADGRTRLVAESEIAAYEKVGWYTYEVTTMYAPDGRTRVVPKEEVAEWEAVGWYTYPVTMLYAPDGRTHVVPKEEVAEWEAVGWYTYPVTMLYAP